MIKNKPVAKKITKSKKIVEALPEDQSKNHQTLKIVSILIGFSQALVIYIASSYFAQVSGRSDVGNFYIFTYVAFLVILLNLHKVVGTIGKNRIFTWSFVGQILVLLGLLFAEAAWLKIVLMILFILFDQLLLISLDILLDAITPKGSAGRTRGSHLVILNIGFIFGPLVSTWLLTNYNFKAVFLAVLIIKLIALAIVKFRLGKIGHVAISRESIGVLLRKAFKNQDVRRIYYISFSLEVFYALMIMYSPIYMRSIGMSLEQIGTAFTFMLIPFIFVEYPIGWLADKELGEKEMIIFFLSWIATATAFVYTLTQPVVWIWALALFATRVGAAALEALRDSYFYKKITVDDVDLIDFYRTARPVAYVVAAGLSVLVIDTYGVPKVFLLTAFVLITALWSAWRLRDNLSEREVLNYNREFKRITLDTD